MSFRKTALLLSAILITACLAAQNIPNNGFENWVMVKDSFETPAHWVTNDMLTHKLNRKYKGHSVSKTDESHSGKYAVKIQVAVNNRDTINGGLYSTGSIDSLLMIYYKRCSAGFKCTARISQFKGFYIFNGVKGDIAIFGLNLTRWNKTVHTRDTLINTTMKIAKEADTYTQFTMPIDYKLTEAPDTAFITIGISGMGKNAAHPGTLLIIDDLVFSGAPPAKK
jgi:hypothetical protein